MLVVDSDTYYVCRARRTLFSRRPVGRVVFLYKNDSERIQALLRALIEWIGDSDGEQLHVDIGEGTRS